MGWGRRCGLGASNSARQPPPMAEAARLWSGCGPARRASHARHPGGAGVRPGGTTAAPRGARRTVTGIPAGSGSTDRTSRWRPGLRRKCRQWSAEGRASFAKDAHASGGLACASEQGRGVHGGAARRSIPLVFSGGPRRRPGAAHSAGPAMHWTKQHWKKTRWIWRASYLAPRVCSRSAMAQRCSGSSP